MIIMKVAFTVYEKQTRDNMKKSVKLSEILSISKGVGSCII